MPIEIAAFRNSWTSWSSLTWFGDSNLLLPAAVALAAVLLLSTATRNLTPRWLLAFGLTGFVVLATKIAFVAWGIGSAELDFTGFSGHSALSACFWPVWAWLLVARAKSPAIRLGAVVAGYLLALAIAVSRLMLEVHSVSEVISGVAIGTAASAWFLAAVRAGRQQSLPTTAAAFLALAFMAVMTITLYGRPAPTTHWIEASTMRMLGITTPFTRQDLRMRLHKL